jgi:putative membrane protein
METNVLVVKALHIIFMVTWFAGLFYLPRLFVYHAASDDSVSLARFVIMERRLFKLMSLGALLTTLLGVWLIVAQPWLLAEGWLHAKLLLVALLIAYHGWCWRLHRQLATGTNCRSPSWYRGFNEVPTVGLVGIVLLAVLRPF